MANFLVIVPSPGLQELFVAAAAASTHQIHVEQITASPIESRQQKEQKEYDAVIGYGTAARQFAEQNKLPFVPLHPSGYDILRTLLLLQGFPGRIGVIGTPATVQGAEEISQLLTLSLTFFSAESSTHEDELLQKAAERGVQAIISDTVGQASAARYGLNVLALTPGKEAVAFALHEAERLARIRIHNESTNTLLEKAIDEHETATIITDAKNNVLFLNEKAQRMINFETKDFSSWIQQFEEQAGGSRKGVDTLNGQTVIVQSKPLLHHHKPIGSVTILETQRTAIQGGQHTAVTTIPLQKQARFPRLIAGTKDMQAQIETARLFSHHDAPVCLYGEKGVGKQSFAEAIHNESSRQSHPFLVVDCGMLGQAHTVGGLFSPDTENALYTAARGGTIFLKQVGRLPLELQDQLLRLLQIKKIEQAEQPAGTRPYPRILASHTHDLKQDVEAGTFREALYHLLNGGTLRLPPLRKRKQDIPELIRWFIVSYNMKEGKQIVGFRPEVMNRLMEGEWPGNVQQLQDVMEEMCRAGNGPFIELEAVEDIVSEALRPLPALESPAAADSKTEEKHKPNGQGIDIAGKTLEQLETEIILRVLEEENNNQSQAAKRLGINRTTLWRKVKEATE